MRAARVAFRLMQSCNSACGPSRNVWYRNRVQLARYQSPLLPDAHCQHGPRLLCPSLDLQARPTRRWSSAPGARASTADAIKEQDQRMHAERSRELHSVNVALGANGIVFCAKMAAWLASGGSALLAEAIHSAADIGNQAMLRLGIVKAAKAPTKEFPYGHLREKFIFSLISAVGIFCLGAGISIVHGIHAIMDPHSATELGWGLTVLFASTFIEGYTLMVATRAVWFGAKAASMRFWDYIRSGRDPVSVAIMAEDGAAVAGVLIAAACTKLVEITGMAMWDGIGSVLVGVLLAGVAVYLIQRNRSFLIGRSMVREDFQKIVRHLKRDPVIKNIYEAKSEEIGEGIFRFNAEIDFDGSKLLERYMVRQDMPRMKGQFAAASHSDDEDDFENIMKAYGTEVVSLVGSEIDRIEEEIMRLVPGVRYVDLETDRGRFGSYTRSSMDTIQIDTFPTVEEIAEQQERERVEETQAASRPSGGGR